MCHRANQTIAQWIMRMYANKKKMMQKMKESTHTHQSSRTKLLVSQNWKSLQAFDYNCIELWIGLFFLIPLRAFFLGVRIAITLVLCHICYRHVQLPSMSDNHAGASAHNAPPLNALTFILANIFNEGFSHRF